MIEIPKQIIFRLLITCDSKTYNKFYWFEMKGDDLYWGSSYKSAIHEEALSEINGNEATITIPKNIDQQPKHSGKFSYHKSGIVHYKKQLESGDSHYGKHSNWIRKDKIKKPVRFYTMFSKTLRHYDKIINNPFKKNNFAKILGFNEECLNKRVYFEFFLSPEGEFQFPKPLIKLSQPIKNIVTHTLSKDLILVIRYAVISNLEEWQTDKELIIMPENLE